VLPYNKEALESLRYLEGNLKGSGMRKVAAAKQEESMSLSLDTSGLLMTGNLLNHLLAMCLVISFQDLHRSQEM